MKFTSYSPLHIVRAFGSAGYWPQPTMPSADFCDAIRNLTVPSVPSGTQHRPPGVSLAAFIITRRIYICSPWWIWTLRRLARSSDCNCLLSGSCSSGHGFAIASFRRNLTMTPLRVASTSPPPGCTGDLHPQAVKHARHTNQPFFKMDDYCRCSIRA